MGVLAGQTWPQVPQFFGSCWRSVHPPSHCCDAAQLLPSEASPKLGTSETASRGGGPLSVGGAVPSPEPASEPAFVDELFAHAATMRKEARSAQNARSGRRRRLALSHKCIG